MTPPRLSKAAFRCKSAPRLYLNPESSQVTAKLLGGLVMNYMHPEAPGVFEVERAVVDENGALGRTLADVQGNTENMLFGFAGVEITGAEEGLEIAAKLKGFDAVIVEFTRFV